MAAKSWHIEQRTGFADYERLKPTLDGKPRLFPRRKDAEAYAYDYQIAGQRNQDVRYVLDVAPAEPYAITRY